MLLLMCLSLNLLQCLAVFPFLVVGVGAPLLCLDAKSAALLWGPREEWRRGGGSWQARRRKPYWNAHYVILTWYTWPHGSILLAAAVNILPVIMVTLLCSGVWWVRLYRARLALWPSLLTIGFLVLLYALCCFFLFRLTRHRSCITVSHGSTASWRAAVSQLSACCKTTTARTVHSLSETVTPLLAISHSLSGKIVVHCAHCARVGRMRTCWVLKPPVCDMQSIRSFSLEGISVHWWQYQYVTLTNDSLYPGSSGNRLCLCLLITLCFFSPAGEWTGLITAASSPEWVKVAPSTISLITFPLTTCILSLSTIDGHHWRALTSRWSWLKLSLRYVAMSYLLSLCFEECDVLCLLLHIVFWSKFIQRLESS